MTVTDGARYAIAMAKLSQARSAVYEATRIIEHLFESGGVVASPENIGAGVCCITDTINNPIKGLYPGQIPDVKTVEEDLEECVE